VGQLMHTPSCGIFLPEASFGLTHDQQLTGLVLTTQLSGTMAHSWVMTFPDEVDAFRSFMAIYGEQSTLLIDTLYAAVARKLNGAREHPAGGRQKPLLCASRSRGCVRSSTLRPAKD